MVHAPYSLTNIFEETLSLAQSIMLAAAVVGSGMCQ